MSDDVDAPWASEADVTDKTHTDIEGSRTYNTKVSDPEFELHRLVETLYQREGLENWSETCDRALRIELASAIDNRDVTFTRDEYDVAYTIPPAGWVGQQVFSETRLVPRDEVDTDDRTIGISMPPVCYEMIREAIDDEGAYDSVTHLVRSGILRLLGRGNM